jgi:hypothetical protein
MGRGTWQPECKYFVLLMMSSSSAERNHRRGAPVPEYVVLVPGCRNNDLVSLFGLGNG